MTEREILELAAKACGQPAERLDVGAWCDCAWNPLHDDGDCARMENMLGIDVTWHFAFIPFVQSKHGDFLLCEFIHNHKDDRGAARRMASLRVAAEIGKAMK